jgi:hypothetical protein
MTVPELTAGVVRGTVTAAVAATLVGAWLAGPTAAVGVLAGGAMAILSFRLLAARLLSVTAPRGWAAPWTLLASARLAVVSGVAVALFVTGWAHPVAWLVGYSALPLAVVVQGLRLARQGERA